MEGENLSFLVCWLGLHLLGLRFGRGERTVGDQAFTRNELEFKSVEISSSFIVHEMTWQVVLHFKKSQIASQFPP